MIYSKGRIAYEEKVKENLATIRAGDYVKVVDCWEAELCGDKALMVLSAPKQIGSKWCVRIEEQGWFDIGRVEKCSET